MNKYSIIKSFLKKLLKEDSETLLNDTGVQFKAWMEANGMTTLANKPEFHDQFQEIIPIVNDNTINMLSKKLFVYNYYWLVSTEENQEVSLPYLAAVSAALCDKPVEKLIGLTTVDDAIEMLYKASDPPKEEEVIYDSNRDPSFVTAMDVLKTNRNLGIPQEFIQYNDMTNLLTIEPVDNSGPYSFEVNGQTINSTDKIANITFAQIEEKLSEQASKALKIWMESAGVSVENSTETK